MRVDCRSCGAKLNAKPEWAGKRAKCNKCGERIVIPHPPATPPELPPTKEKPKKPVPQATEKQKAYAESLGIDFPDGINIRDMSALIDAAKNGDYERIDAAYEKRDEQWEKIREAVIKEIEDNDCLLSKADGDQMIEVLQERDLAAVLITIPSDRVVYGDETTEEALDHLRGTPVSIHFTDDMDENDMWRLIEAMYLNHRVTDESK